MGTGMMNGALVVAGGVLGATAFIRMQPYLQRARASPQKIERSAEDGPIVESKPTLDIATALRLHPIAMLMIWVPMCLAVILTAHANDSTTHAIPASGLVRPAYGGLLIGTAQLVTTLLTGHAIGGSAAYQDVATWLDKKIWRKSEDQRGTPFLTPSLLFSSGVVAAAAFLSYMIPKIGNANANTFSTFDPSKAVITVLGGGSMVFGARLAGGCTSGHGISGLSKFSLASLATTVSMFSAGVLTASVAL